MSDGSHDYWERLVTFLLRSGIKFERKGGFCVGLVWLVCIEVVSGVRGIPSVAFLIEGTVLNLILSERDWYVFGYEAGRWFVSERVSF
jgi:hypothetical protein